MAIPGGTQILTHDGGPIAAPRTIRVAIICDFLEENWPSMDLVGDMLYKSLSAEHYDTIHAVKVRPELNFRSARRSHRFFGRFLQYPRELARIRKQYDIFHIVDHSYSHLVHSLPPERTVITCHDLDTFRSVLEPNRERRSLPFRLMTRRILRGLQHAAHITCDTAATRDSIVQHQLVDRSRLTVVHNGVRPEFSPDPCPTAELELSQILGRRAGQCLELLHVGSTIARKRIDVLLRVFAELRKKCPNARLLRIGGAFTREQQQLAQQLGVNSYIDVLPRLNAQLIAAAYRRASVVLQPSESEGFGLPVIEALACGTPVVASNIPALREVGGDAVTFCPVGDIDSWIDSVHRVITTRPDRSTLTSQGAKFSWKNYAGSMVEIYRRILFS
jgi:glycosyltransferase involved in cell wall biosynthesis